MNFDRYQQQVAEYGDKFTANHQPGWQRFLATGLCEEAGEVPAIIRKAHRKNVDVNTTKLAEELGNVLCYLAYIAYRNGLSLTDIAQINIEQKVNVNHSV